MQFCMIIRVEAAMTLKLTSRGQVTFRKELLQHLGIEPGQEIELEKLPNGAVTLRAARAKGKIEDVFGILAGKSKVKLTIEQMNEAIAEGWAGKR
jgi:antitoxin PrlF